MTAAAVLNGSAADGVTITLSLPGTLKVAGEQAMVSHWLASIREHKPGIIALLSDTPGAVAAEPFAFGAPPAPSLASISVQASKCAPDTLAGVIRQRWSLTFDDRNPVRVIVWPGATFTEVMAQWPSALSATPTDLGR